MRLQPIRSHHHRALLLQLLESLLENPDPIPSPNPHQVLFIAFLPELLENDYVANIRSRAKDVGFY